MSISFHGINVNVADIDEGALPPPSKSFFRADCELLADGFVGQGADARADLLNFSARLLKRGHLGFQGTRQFLLCDECGFLGLFQWTCLMCDQPRMVARLRMPISFCRSRVIVRRIVVLQIVLYNGTDVVYSDPYGLENSRLANFCPKVHPLVKGPSREGYGAQ
jgi:hypothetical protein